MSTTPPASKAPDINAENIELFSADPDFFTDAQDRFIDYEMWDKYYPYQLLVLEASGEGDELVYKRTKMFYTLPISPQEMNISMPIAVNTQATLTGIVEQHGGAPFRIITMSGTTGLVNRRATPDKPTAFQTGLHAVGTVFGGTANNIGRVARIAQNGFGSALNVHTGLSKNHNDEKKIFRKDTGYAQIRLLQRFIETYVAMKSGKGDKTHESTTNSTHDPKKLRLALAIWKDQAVYLCSLNQFDIKRSAQNPMEYMWSMQMKAWRRVSVEDGAPLLGDNHSLFKKRDFATLNAILKAVRAIAAIVATLRDVISSIVKDLTKFILGVIREISNFVKSVLGLLKSIADFVSPETWKTMGAQIAKEWESLKGSASEAALELMSAFDAVTAKTGGVARFAGPGSEADTVVNAAVDEITNLTEQNSEHYATLLSLLDRISLENLPGLDGRTKELIKTEEARILALTRRDWEERRDELRAFIAKYEALLGIGAQPSQVEQGGNLYVYNYETSTYITTEGEPDLNLDQPYTIVENLLDSATTITKPIRAATDDDYEAMYAMNGLAQALDSLSANKSIDAPEPSTLEYVAGLAQRSGIAFKVPTSKFAVPFPYGFSLERLALLYLGDIDRWHEIATLNGLQTPYVDEEGFTLTLLTNADRNQIVVGETTNLYVNQTVYLSGNGLDRTKRHITKIDEIGDNDFVVTLDGDPDLQQFTTYAESKLEAFLPGTVNSRQVIFIPSDVAAGDFDTESRAIPGVDAFDPLLEVAGEDLLLTTKGDLAITPDGDCGVAVGLQNIVQTVRLALTTPLGGLLHHPEYGIMLQSGMSTADVTAEELLAQVKKLFADDGTFTGVRSASVAKNGNSMVITIEVGIAGVSKFIPISVEIKN